MRDQEKVAKPLQPRRRGGAGQEIGSRLANAPYMKKRPRAHNRKSSLKRRRGFTVVQPEELKCRWQEVHPPTRNRSVRNVASLSNLMVPGTMTCSTWKETNCGQAR